jgi:putative membrane protein
LKGEYHYWGLKFKDMIKRYTDHSANERTYLAWIRTSVAIMAFGFLIEKFDIFISYIGKAVGDEKHFKPSLSAELAGLSLFLVGVLIIVTATIRFFMYKKSIESEEFIPYSVKKTNLSLSALMIFIAVFLIVYLVHQII